MNSLKSVISRLRGVRRQGSGYIALCPAHEDHHRSLSVSVGTQDKVLLTCHAGCAFENIVAALDMEAKDLFPDNGNGSNKREIAAVYDYVTTDGELHHQTVRYDNKSFTQRRPDGAGGWIWNLKDITPVLYNLPQVTKAIQEGRIILVLEGEKDCDNAKSKLGVVATTNPMGAGKWHDYYSNSLTGAKVVIIGDNDEPGRKHAAQVAASLYGKAASVKIVELPGVPEKGDLSDWLSAGGTRDGLKDLIRQAREFEPTEEAAPAINPTGVLLSEVVPEKVKWLWPGRIPQGKLTVLDGDPGLGKSTATLFIAACVSQGRPLPGSDQGVTAAGVVLLSAEDGLADTIKPRLMVAGADNSRILALTEVPDSEPGEMRPPMLPDDIEAIRCAIKRVDAKLLIIDPLMAFLSGDVKGNRDQDVRRALHRMAQLAEDTGAAVLVVRHLNKSGGGNAIYRGGGSIGIIAAARSGLLVAKDPDDEARRVLASTKSNLCKSPESLSFYLEDFGGTPRLVWDGVSAHNADSLLSTLSDEESNALQEAEEVLSDILSNGPVEANEVKKQAKIKNVSKRTLERAKANLGVISRKSGGPRAPWIWELCKFATSKSGSRVAKGGDQKGNKQTSSSEAIINTEFSSQNLTGRQISSNGTLGNLKSSGAKLWPCPRCGKPVKVLYGIAPDIHCEHCKDQVPEGASF